MMKCVQYYLNNGIVSVEAINLNKTKMWDQSNKEFIEFAEDFIDYNTWLDKRFFQDSFEEYYPEVEQVSPHQFTKWITNYSNEVGGTFDTNSTGGSYNFIIRMKEVSDGV